MLRLAEGLISRACRSLPDEIRDDRYREWTAELPHILADPGIRFAPRRALRTLLFAADQSRGARPPRRRSQSPGAAGNGWRPARAGSRPRRPDSDLARPTPSRVIGAAVAVFEIVLIVSGISGWALDVYAGVGLLVLWLMTLARSRHIRHINRTSHARTPEPSLRRR